MDLETFDNLRRNAAASLMSEKDPRGYWEGELSSSALSTATAVTALHFAGDSPELIERGLHWLSSNANGDGGWGDTVRSHSNISTTALCWAAFAVSQHPAIHQETIQRAERWLVLEAGSLDPDDITKTIMARYGKDHTFSIPILTMLTLCGRLGDKGWGYVAPLPFELAALPHGLFHLLRLPVVSYALPALIAIGQTIHHHRGSKNPLRQLTKKKTLKLLEKIQPSNGGFLEAIPLTSFVAMSLAGMGLGEHVVVRKGVSFIQSLVRDDGGWPIDTHLATWLTTLSINALDSEEWLNTNEKSSLASWLLSQQHLDQHPYTGAAPGGWAWTPEPGGVPDADDTSGAVLALARLDLDEDWVQPAAESGIDWLVDLQNRDGGIPTFCKGWGTLPFDKSCPDITAHFLLALSAWCEKGVNRACRHRAADRALNYLKKEQQADGSWLPLWFGNQDAANQGNPTYGTGRVLLALQNLACHGLASRRTLLENMIDKGRTWLLQNRNPDGGWGGSRDCVSTLEETSLALHALAQRPKDIEQEISEALNWINRASDGGRVWNAAPIGFYFANLWYFEKLYPLVFTVGALETVEKSGLFKNKTIPKQTVCAEG